MKYIITDPIAWLTALYAIEDMGKMPYISSILLMGPPGCGKSYLAKYISHKINAKLLHFQAFPGCGKEDLLYGPADINGIRTKGLLIQCAEMSLVQKVNLLIDEGDKAAHWFDHFLLNFLNDGIVWVPPAEPIKANLANIIVTMTMNDDRPPTSPLMRRNRTCVMEWPTVDIEKTILLDAVQGLDDAAAVELIGRANSIRETYGVLKPPSPPELVRLSIDIFRSLREKQGPNIIGRYAFNALLNRAEDQIRFRQTLNVNELGATLSELFEPGLDAFLASNQGSDLFLP